MWQPLASYVALILNDLIRNTLEIPLKMAVTSLRVPEYELDDTKLKHDELDEGRVVVADPGTLEHVELDEKENRRVLRKIDWHLMPLMCLVYGLQFVSERCSMTRRAHKTRMRAIPAMVADVVVFSLTKPRSAMQGKDQWAMYGRRDCLTYSDVDSVMGIRQARHIDLSEYSWLSSAFCE